MIKIYKVTVFEKDKEIMTFISPKSTVFERISNIMSDMNKDITFQIKLAQQ